MSLAFEYPRVAKEVLVHCQRLLLDQLAADESPTPALPSYRLVRGDGETCYAVYRASGCADPLLVVGLLEPALAEEAERRQVVLHVVPIRGPRILEVLAEAKQDVDVQRRTCVCGHELEYQDSTECPACGRRASDAPWRRP